MPSAPRRLRRVAIVLALVAVPVLAGPVQAHGREPVTVDLTECVYGSGEVTVDAKSPLLLQVGWAALSIPHQIAFRISERTIASIDGHRIRHTERYWQRPEKTFPFPDLPWVMYWQYPHKSLKAGASITVTHDWYLRFAVSDGVDTYPRGLVNAPLGALPSCTITAS